MAIFYHNTNPTINDVGYKLDDVWFNTVTYTRYKFTDNNTWSYKSEGNGVFYSSEGYGMTLNNMVNTDNDNDNDGGDTYGRPSDWLQLPTQSEGEQSVIGLYAVYPHNSNFVGVNISGDYIIDWGDGIVEEYNSGENAYHNFKYEDFNTQTESTYGYKQSIITITPQNGGMLTYVILNVKHFEAELNAYSTQWLDIRIVGENINGLEVMASEELYNNHLKIFGFVGANSIVNFAYMFYSCVELQTILSLNTINGTNFNNMFSNCTSIKTIPLLNTINGTNFNYMFNNCTSIKTIPLLNTINGTDFNNMFSNCTSLETIPLLNTINGIYFTNMFISCTSLEIVPELNTINGTDFNYMFSNCTSIKTIPLLNTINGINFYGMFSSCTSLQIIPALNLTNGTDIQYMFNECYSLGRSEVINTKSNISYSYCKLSGLELNNIYANLPVADQQRIMVYGNWGVALHDPTIATAKGWTVHSVSVGPH